MKTRPVFSTAILTIACALSLTTAGASVLLNDSFDRSTLGPQNLPTSTQWYGSSNTNATIANGSLTLDTAGGTTSGMLTAYFTDSGTVSLNSGQTLTLSFDFSVSGIDATTGFLRVGLFDSGGNRLTAQGQDANNTLFRNYTGYASGTNLSTNNNNIYLNKRDVLPNSGLLNTNNAYTAIGTSGSAFKLENGVTYNSTLTLYHTGTEIILTQTYSGGSLNNITLTRTDSTDLYTTFDTVAIALQGSAANSITLSNLSVTLIPEPSSVAWAGALIGIGACALLRRRRK